VPALRERPDDIPVLANAFLRTTGQGVGMHFTESAIQRLRSYAYPGNIRELRNIVIRCSIIGNSNVIDSGVVERAISGQVLQNDSGTAAAISPQQTSATGNSVKTLRQVESQHLNFLMRHFAGDKNAVARAAGISVRSLYRRLTASE